MNPEEIEVQIIPEKEDPPPGRIGHEDGTPDDYVEGEIPDNWSRASDGTWVKNDDDSR